MAIFNSYVSLPEGNPLSLINFCFPASKSFELALNTGSAGPAIEGWWAGDVTPEQSVCHGTALICFRSSGPAGVFKRFPVMAGNPSRKLRHHMKQTRNKHNFQIRTPKQSHNVNQKLGQWTKYATNWVYEKGTVSIHSFMCQREHQSLVTSK